MNAKCFITMAGIAAVPFGALAQSGGPWTILSSTIDGGGGTSAGGVWTLTGTIGQADAAPPATGGTRVVQGGFWPGTVVHIFGGPLLSMAQGALSGQPGTVRISWGDDAAGYRLQSSSDLSLWTDTPTIPTGAGHVYVPYSSVRRLFFRLRKLP